MIDEEATNYRIRELKAELDKEEIALESYKIRIRELRPKIRKLRKELLSEQQLLWRHKK